MRQLFLVRTGALGRFLTLALIPRWSRGSQTMKISPRKTTVRRDNFASRTQVQFRPCAAFENRSHRLRSAKGMSDHEFAVLKIDRNGLKKKERLDLRRSLSFRRKIEWR